MGSIASFRSVGVTVAPAAFAAAVVSAEGTTSELLMTDRFKGPGLTNSSAKRLMAATTKVTAIGAYERPGRTVFSSVDAFQRNRDRQRRAW
jgi:hypothetical protein